MASLLSLAAGIAMLSAPVAAEAGTVITRKASAHLPAAFDQPAVATARCPRGSKVISGGWSIDPVSTGIEVYESRRIPPRRWRVSVVNANAPAAARLTAFVYCGRTAPYATTVISRTPDTTGAVQSATARCPRGRSATAGGLLSEVGGPGQALLPLESRRTDRRTWLVATQKAGFAKAGLIAFAYCTRNAGPLRTRIGTAPLTDAGGSALTGRCPKPSGARSGGFEIVTQTAASKYGISESRRVGRRWRTTATILAPSAPDTEIISRAFCP